MQAEIYEYLVFCVAGVVLLEFYAFRRETEHYCCGMHNVPRGVNL